MALNKEAAKASEGLISLSQMKTPLAASSATDCKAQSLLFQDLGSRDVVADFSGGTLSTDAGALLLREVDANLGLTQRLAQCFDDGRNQVWVEHSVPQMLAQRIYGLALGYEDINDHQRLRLDPLLATACNKTDPLGEQRINPADRGIALAAPATLNRMELSNNRSPRCHKVPHDPAQIEACLLAMGARCLPKHSQEVVVDLDAMGHRLHGAQEGRHFNAYYDDYCYLPLYAFVGDFPLWAQLRTADHEAAHGVVPALEKIVASIRQRCRKARIIVRGDTLRDRMQDTAKELNLTDEQKNKLQVIIRGQAGKLRDLRQDTSLAPEDKKEKLRALREEITAEVKKVLTPEQFEKWRAKQGQLAAGGGAPLARVQEAIKDLNLTDQQPEQLKPVYQVHLRSLYFL
jgi:Spy/CpxP family protein refolding chaperone